VPERSSSLTEAHLANVSIYTGGSPTAFVAPCTHCAQCVIMSLAHTPELWEC
jgi:hypothetical protein